MIAHILEEGIVYNQVWIDQIHHQLYSYITTLL